MTTKKIIFHENFDKTTALTVNIMASFKLSYKQ